MKINKIYAVIFSIFFMTLTINNASAGEFDAKISAYADEIRAWLSDPVVVNAVIAQNAANENLSQSDIDALDKKWRAESSASDKPFINELLGRDISTFLKSKESAAGGLITELFIMDNKGLNVGQSQITSDYWQGDEGKWQNTYKNGADAIDISDVELDESTQTYQSQLSLSVVDASGKAIGAITIGLNVEMLQ